MSERVNNGKTPKKVPVISIMGRKASGGFNPNLKNNFFLKTIYTKPEKSETKRMRHKLKLNLEKIGKFNNWRSKTDRGRPYKSRITSPKSKRNLKRHALKGKRQMQFKTINCQKERKSVQIKRSKEISYRILKNGRSLKFDKKKGFLLRVLKQSLKKSQYINFNRKMKQICMKKSQHNKMSDNGHLSDILNSGKPRSSPLNLFESSKSNYQMGFFVERLKSIYKRRTEGSSKIMSHKAINRLQNIIRNNIFLFKKSKQIILEMLRGIVEMWWRGYDHKIMLFQGGY